MSGHDPRRQDDRTRRADAHRSRPLLEMLEHRVVLSTFKVNSMADTVAVNLKTGQDASGQITLRSAIMAANATHKSNTIVLPAGTIKLTIAGAGENADATGDLDITGGKLTIKGKGAGASIVDGNQLDRVFDILGGNITLSKLTIQNGRATQGAGLLNEGGSVSLTSVAIQNNTAVGAAGAAGANGSAGGSVGNDGGAGGTGSDAQGGGVFNGAGLLKITSSVISSNQAIGGSGGSGGVGGNSDSAAPVNGTNGRSKVGGAGGAGGAGGSGFGGGVFNAAGAQLTLTATTLTTNFALGGAGGAGGAGVLHSDRPAAMITVVSASEASAVAAMGARAAPPARARGAVCSTSAVRVRVVNRAFSLAIEPTAARAATAVRATTVLAVMAATEFSTTRGAPAEMPLEAWAATQAREARVSAAVSPMLREARS